MDIKAYPKGELVYYVPKWKAQREMCKKGELGSPVTAVISPLTRGEMKRYLKAAENRELASVAGELFCNHVTEIRNLSINAQSILNGKQLWELDDAPPEVEELVGELLSALLDSSVLSDGEVKKLKN